MKNIEYSLKILPQLFDLINEHIASVPPYWTVDEVQVNHVITQVPHLWDRHYPENKLIERVSRLLCLEDQDNLITAGQLSYSPDFASGLQIGIIDWIFSRQGDVSGLRLLLDQMISLSKEAGLNRLVTHRCAFGVGWDGVSDGWPHIIAGFNKAGFTPIVKWSFFRKVNGYLPEDRHGIPIDVIKISDEEPGEWRLNAFSANKFVGECEAWQIPVHFSGCADFAKWITIEFLGVVPSLYRMGIGTRLLTDQLRWQREFGRDEVLFWTEAENQAMVGLAHSMGFVNCGGSICFEIVL